VSGAASSSPVEIEREALAETLRCAKRFIVESLDSRGDGDTRRLRARYQTA